MTRTNTFYFTPEDLQNLQNEYDALAEDWADRKKYVPPDVQHAGDVRLRALEAALILLREPVSEAFY